MSRQQNARRRRKERAETAVVSQAGDAPAAPAAPMAVDAGSLRAFMRREAWAILALALLVAVSYWPATQAGFVWDDVIFTTSDAVRNWSGLWEMWFAPGNVFTTRGGLGSGNTIEGHYWPITYTTFWIEHKLWGSNPTGYHVVNVLLHLANTLLLLRLLQRLAVPGAWFVAAVFAVHPLHVESVAWVIERKDLLSALFYLSAMLAWLRLVEAPDWRRYALMLALFAAGMLSKSMVVTLPAALLILAWWKRGRVSLATLVRVLPLFAAGLVIALADLAFYRAREAVSFDFSLMERAPLAARLLWFYAGKLLWPTDLAVIYAIPAPDIADPTAWGYALAALALAALLWFARHRVGRGPLAGALFFVVTLSPVLGFVDFGYMQFSFAADRFQYLAGIGVMAVAVGAAAHGVGRCPPWAMRGIQVLAVAVLALFGTLTWRQSGVWQDELTLFSHVVSLNPQARSAYLNLGKALLDAGRLEESVAASRIAVEQKPDNVNAHNNLGLAFYQLGQIDEAERHYRRGLELDPRHKESLQNLAELLRKREQYAEAIQLYTAVVETNPKLASAHAGMGLSLLEMARFDEAIASLERALALHSPEEKLLHANIGLAFFRLGQLDEAERHYRRGLELDPRHKESLQNLAELLRKRGQYAESIPFYAAVIETDPELAQAHAGMGLSLLEMARLDEAIASLERALALHSPKLPLLHVALGRAAEGAGRPEAAAEHYERALAVAPRYRAALSRLGALRFGQERFEEALEHFRTETDVDPGNAPAWFNQGVALYHLERYEEAMRIFDRALSIDPELESARAGREQARQRIGRAEGQRRGK